MSKAGPDPAKRRSSSSSADYARPGTPDAAPAPIFRPPFAPRRGLFYLLLGAFGVWVVILLTMYFVTVYPNRDAHQHVGDAVPAAPDSTDTPEKTVSR